MTMRLQLWVACVSLATVGLCAAPAQGQRLLGGDAVSGGIWEFTTTPGGPCGFPNTARDFCTPGTACPGITPPSPTAGSLLGDIATDRINDTIWVTDGRTLHEYSGDLTCVTPTLSCTPLVSIALPSFIGNVTGMGIDSRGGTVTPLGTPAIWVTDGALVAAFVSNGNCLAPTLVSGPFPHGIGGAGIMTDISWDPFTGTLWLPDTLGGVHNMFIGGGAASPSFLATPGTCGSLVAPLVGLAVDTAWPASGGPPPGTPKMYVTDGLTVDYVTDTGAPAAGTFYTPVNCTPTNGLLNGLALTGHGVTFGQPRINARIGSFGQSSSPGPSFGLELHNAPAGHFVWLVYNFSFPGPGFFCPSVGGAGTQLWVDPGFPGGVNFFGNVTGPCVSYPLPLPNGLPNGLTIFVQFITTPVPSPRASDATEGLAFTIHRP